MAAFIGHGVPNRDSADAQQGADMLVKTPWRASCEICRRQRLNLHFRVGARAKLQPRVAHVARMRAGAGGDGTDAARFSIARSAGKGRASGAKPGSNPQLRRSRRTGIPPIQAIGRVVRVFTC